MDDRQAMVEATALQGTPAEVGAVWGQINRAAIHRDMEEQYRAPAQAAGLSAAQLARQADAFVRIVQDLAPHWLTENAAIAAAAGVDEALYTGFVANVYRRLFLEPECTSYATGWEHNADHAIFFHKTRDNVGRDQSAFLLDSGISGVHRFLAVSDASVLAAMMMVNDQGLAGSADTGGLPVAKPRSRGLMNTAILRYIAERAATTDEAEDIIRTIVGRGQYAGGSQTGTHWLFVDRRGVIIEVSNNSDEVVAQRHEEKVYFSARGDGGAGQALRQASSIDFGLFHGVSREPSICFDTSISGMTVEIDRERPATFTRAWFCLPARSAAFPMHMGQSGTPRCLLDGRAYVMGERAAPAVQHWEALERRMHQDAATLVDQAAAAGATELTQRLDEWSRQQAGRVLEELDKRQPADRNPA